MSIAFAVRWAAQGEREFMQRISLLERRVWVIRGGEAGVGEHEEEFLSAGLITVGFGCDKPVTDFRNRAELRRYLEDERQHEGRNSAPQLWDFAFEMRAGDNVVLTRTMKGQEGELALGRVTGDYKFRADHFHRHWRPVEWLSIGVAKTGLDARALGQVNRRPTLTLVKDEQVARRIRAHCLAR